MAAALLSTFASPRPAHASDPAAESLFQEGLKLLKNAKPEEACPKLRASYALEQRSGTLIALAFCNENRGKLATAWAQYKDAGALARKEGRDAHAQKADRLAAKLEPKLPKLRITAPTEHLAQSSDPQPLAQQPNTAQARNGQPYAKQPNTVQARNGQRGTELMITLDGRAVLPGQLGVAVALDPGEHVIQARAPGYETWSLAILIRSEAKTHTVAIPELKRLPKPPPPPEPQGPAPASSPAPKDASPPAAVDHASPPAPVPNSNTAGVNAATSNTNTTNTAKGNAARVNVTGLDKAPLSTAPWGYAVGSVGLASVGVSLALGAVVIGHNATVEAECDQQTRICSQAGLDANEAAKPLATAATALFAAGVAASGVGLFLILWEPDTSANTALSLTPLTTGGAHLQFEHRF